MDAKEILSRLTLKEKCSLLSGGSYWKTRRVKEVPPVMMADGPHGLRKQVKGDDRGGIQESVPATCFPTASLSASAWDRGLMRELGRAIGEEARANGVYMVLGPGMNIKRSPLSGRNFEYFSADPLLTGEMAAAYAAGMEEAGATACLKHYCANSQESWRLINDSVVDERTLREIYLRAFEIAVKKGRPGAVMCSYNRLNGEYLSDSKRLLTDVLRGEWGFEGIVVTDWGACNDRVLGVKAGLNLEMPTSKGMNDKRVRLAVKKGELTEAQLDAVVARNIEFVLKGAAVAPKTCDYAAHHALGRKIAARGAVLLKNDGLLPLSRGMRIAVIGDMAVNPRYQGAGSSYINPIKLDCALDQFKAAGAEVVYAPDDVKKAADAARNADAAVVFTGLPATHEAEGFDRTTLDLPDGANALVRAVAAVNKRTAVVISAGAPVTMPWVDEVSAVLYGYLAGEAGAGGLVDILLGEVNPSGRLAESFPLRLTDVPCHGNFANDEHTTRYDEGVMVDYRHYESAGISVLFPFGHGLSYTSFEYANMTVDGLAVSLDVTNTGERAGAEVVQIYAALPDSRIERPAKALAGFEKVHLQPGQRERVRVDLDVDAVGYYDVSSRAFCLEAGEYVIMAGASCADIRQRVTVSMGDVTDPADERVYVAGQRPPATRALKTLKDMRSGLFGKALYAIARRVTGVHKARPDDPNARMMSAMLNELPLRAMVNMSGVHIPLWVQRLLYGKGGADA